MFERNLEVTQLERDVRGCRPPVVCFFLDRGKGLTLPGFSACVHAGGTFRSNRR